MIAHFFRFVNPWVPVEETGAVTGRFLQESGVRLPKKDVFSRETGLP